MSGHIQSFSLHLPRVDDGNYRAAIDLALVLQRTDDVRAATLLDMSEAVIRQGTRLGVQGFGLADAQILAVRGAKREALAALQRGKRPAGGALYGAITATTMRTWPRSEDPSSRPSSPTSSATWRSSAPPRRASEGCAA